MQIKVQPNLDHFRDWWSNYVPPNLIKKVSFLICFILRYVFPNCFFFDKVPILQYPGDCPFPELFPVNIKNFNKEQCSTHNQWIFPIIPFKINRLYTNGKLNTSQALMKKKRIPFSWKSITSENGIYQRETYIKNSFLVLNLSKVAEKSI